MLEQAKLSGSGPFYAKASDWFPIFLFLFAIIGKKTNVWMEDAKIECIATVEPLQFQI